jgi:hypothetical protein
MAVVEREEALARTGDPSARARRQRGVPAPATGLVALRLGPALILTLWKVVNHKKVKKNVDTGTALVTQANASKFSGP